MRDDSGGSAADGGDSCERLADGHYGGRDCTAPPSPVLDAVAGAGKAGGGACGGRQGVLQGEELLKRLLSLKGSFSVEPEAPEG